MTLLRKYAKFNIAGIICLFAAVVMLTLGNELKSGVAYGLEISYNIIIPTLFPFFILSDLWAHSLSVSSDSFLGKMFYRLFGISGSGASAFICGMFCGFPIGVKASVNGYKLGKLDLDQTQLLCALASNPSCAFVISGIGLGMYKDIRIGILLYFCVIIAAVIIGFLFRIRNNKCNFTSDISGQSFNLVESIRNAGLSSISVCSYIIFFSALIGLFRSVCKINVMNIVFSCLAEVSFACLFLKENSPLPSPISLALTAFALGFSGFSVHMQAFSFMPREISRKKYLLTRLLIGFTSGAISFILFTIIKAVAI